MGVAITTASSGWPSRSSSISRVAYTVANCVCTRSSRSPSRSHTAVSLTPGMLAKLRVRLGPQYPSPTIPTRTMVSVLLAFRRSQLGNRGRRRFVPPAQRVRDLPHDGRRRREQDPEIQPWRSSPDVGEIEAYHFRERRSVLPADLPKARHAGKHSEASRVPRLILKERVRAFRARTNQAHFPTQHVDQLRDLVQTRFPQDKTVGDDAGVVIVQFAQGFIGRDLVSDPPFVHGRIGI